MKINLIVSTYRLREIDAQSELHWLLNSFGDENPTFQITKLSGILTARTNLDPFQVVRRLKGLIHEEPWNVRFILRMIPIEFALFDAGTDLVKEAFTRLSSKMKRSDTFRITVEKRGTPISSSEIISKIGSIFDNPVNLENPCWLVLVEIIGKVIGVSILRPDDIFSLEREIRREL